MNKKQVIFDIYSRLLRCCSARGLVEGSPGLIALRLRLVSLLYQGV